MHRPFHCPHCRRASHIVTPAPWTRLLLGFAWVHAAVWVVCAAMLGPFLLLVVPFVMAFALGLITGAHQLAGEPPNCEACGKIVAREAAAVHQAAVAVRGVRVA